MVNYCLKDTVLHCASVASCYRNRVKLWPCGLHWLLCDVNFFFFTYSTLILRYCIACLFFQFCKQTQRWRQNGPWNLLPLWEAIMALAFCITVGSGVTVGSRLTGRWQGDFSFFRTVSFLMQLRTGALSHTVTIIWPIVVHYHKTNSSCF